MTAKLLAKMRVAHGILVRAICDAVDRGGCPTDIIDAATDLGRALDALPQEGA